MANGMNIAVLITLALVIVVAGLVAAFGSDIMTDIQTDYTGVSGCNATTTDGCGFAYNNTRNGLLGVAETTERLDTVAVVVVAGIVISVLIAAFAFALTRR